MGVEKSNKSRPKISCYGGQAFKLSPEPERSNCICYWNVAKISLPQILTTVSFQVTNVMTVYFIGHYCSKEIMAGVGMGNVIVGSFCMAFCFGLNGTLESKVSQSYGAENYEMCGVWLNRGRMINTVLMVPILFLFLSSQFFLESIGID
jgi:multidrug resistance protein, MATE family